MDKRENLIVALAACIPQLDIAPLYASLPGDTQKLTELDWLYQHLSEQNLMVYEEWKEYSGDIPELKPLANIALSEEPAEFIFSLIEETDWSESSFDPYELPYIIPWLEHINFYLQPHGVRLVNLLPFENAYILCVRDDEVLLDKLHSSLEMLGMGINGRQAMNEQQVRANIEAIISE